jgi:hypothetical protein
VAEPIVIDSNVSPLNEQFSKGKFLNSRFSGIEQLEISYLVLDSKALPLNQYVLEV